MQRSEPNVPTVSTNLWRPGTRNGTNQALTVIARSIMSTSLVFMVFPTIDLTVSRWFAKGAVFVLAEQPFLKGLRDFSRESLIYIITATVVILCLNVVAPKR